VTGLYDIPVVHITLKAVFTNTIPISTYRGAGRPEGIYMIERLVDRAAQELRIDPAELRARNLVRAAQLPYRNATGTLYDSGEFGANMRRALALARRASAGCAASASAITSRQQPVSRSSAWS
jgi:aerobic carbon-monoxide dehydrogenase large subunit